MNNQTNVLASLLMLAALLPGQQDPPQGSQQKPGFDQAATELQKQLQAAVAELAQLRQQVADEQVPKSRQLAELEAELSVLRGELQQKTRLLDGRSLDLSNLRTEIKARQDETSYLGTLLGDYVRNFESRLHIAELQRYQKPLAAAKLAAENSALDPQQVFAQQSVLLSLSLDRLEDALGGARFDGTAVDSGGLVRNGTFVVVGPSAVFRTAEGSEAGVAEQRLGSLEPTLLPFGSPEQAKAAANLVATGQGEFPIDPTLGNAHKVEAIEETLVEHFLKGGPVMWPMLALSSLALLVALYRWIGLLFVRKPSPARVRELLTAVAARDPEGAMARAKAIRGPTGRMLVAGVEHMREPRELMEEVMYETVLETKLRLNRLLPFIALTATSAPLLGLLGTVTGIMNTFTLMTVFGTGDVKTLSSGISEALITTEYGLYIAIPSLILYAYLSRKAKGIVEQMEKAAIAFANEATKSLPHPVGAAGEG